MNFYEEFLNKLPPVLNRWAPNWMKLASWIQGVHLNLWANIELIDDVRDLDVARGRQLDLIGAQYNEPRGKADDSFYRVMIRSKIMTNKGDSSVNGLLSMIYLSLGVEKSPIEIKSVVGEPNTIVINNIPLNWSKNEWERDYIIARIIASVSAGIRVDSVSFMDRSKGVLNVTGLTTNTFTYHVTGGS